MREDRDITRSERLEAADPGDPLGDASGREDLRRSWPCAHDEPGEHCLDVGDEVSPDYSGGLLSRW